MRVERGHDLEPLRRESLVTQNGPPQVAHADQDHLPLLVETEDPPQFAGKALHVVAAPLLAEAPEVAQVLADLGRRHAQLVAQLLRADNLTPLRLQHPKRARVDRQSIDYNLWNAKQRCHRSSPSEPQTPAEAFHPAPVIIVDATIAIFCTMLARRPEGVNA